ncbi:hypothetical protein [Pelagicoccus sp. SDUM812002]|uniref:hypothetical protein n=1 Tax=Pelagicoccus sp. SDUM812002 TaxID=3041266 RepID=UPI00280F5452|nr:hypothetical protein [Pelagicoccus sp. SDUM812002]MDQ8188286.1 hypothetical protein [Pelagicoccus sp. SDUM812002]
MFEMLDNEATSDLALDWIRADQSRRFASRIALSGLDPERKEMFVELLGDRYAHRSNLNKFGADVLPEQERQGIETSYRAELSSLVGD